MAAQVMIVLGRSGWQHTCSAQGAAMINMLAAIRVVAVVCVALLAGIYLGYLAGAYYALKELSASSFVQFQQVVHLHYAQFMPPLVLTALVTTVAWLVLIRSEWRSVEFWLVAASMCGVIAIAGMTRAVNVPLNNELMTWSIAAPPSNLKEIWAPWDRVNAIRTIIAVGVLVLQTVALSLRASFGHGPS